MQKDDGLMMSRLNPFSFVETGDILRVVRQYGCPAYLYDEGLIIQRCKAVLSMPNAYGLSVRYAMKANSNRSLLQRIHSQGLLFDASSMNEVRRARLAGIGYEKIILTTQEVPLGEEKQALEHMIQQGLTYNACSLRQLYEIGDFASRHHPELAIRIHPGVGSGESATRNTGDKYSCFGIHLSDIGQALAYAQNKGLRFTHVHVHIGSGADPDMWRQNIDLELEIIEQHFPHAFTVSFGGGLREARMPDEVAADLQALGAYAKEQVERFYARTGRKLHMEIEPGTYIVANSGYAVTEVIDKKRTGEDGLQFVLTNGGMELNARPLFYGSRHPFYIISKNGSVLSSEFDLDKHTRGYEAVIVGRCCESGDSQCLTITGQNQPRAMAEPELGDIVVIGGVGAYCSSMSPFNYNAHVQAPEILRGEDGHLRLIRKRQTVEQMLQNEL